MSSMFDATHQRRCHFHQRRGQDIREDERPLASHGLGPTSHEPQPSGEIIQTRVLRSDVQCVSIDVKTDGPWHAQEQRREREHAGSCSDIKHACRPIKVYCVIERFEAENSGRVQPP